MTGIPASPRNEDPDYWRRIAETLALKIAVRILATEPDPERYLAMCIEQVVNEPDDSGPTRSSQSSDRGPALSPGGEWVPGHFVTGSQAVVGATVGSSTGLSTGASSAVSSSIGTTSRSC